MAQRKPCRFRMVVQAGHACQASLRVSTCPLHGWDQPTVPLLTLHSSVAVCLPRLLHRNSRGISCQLRGSTIPLHHSTHVHDILQIKSASKYIFYRTVLPDAASDLRQKQLPCQAVADAMWPSDQRSRASGHSLAEDWKARGSMFPKGPHDGDDDDCPHFLTTTMDAFWWLLNC